MFGFGSGFEVHRSPFTVQCSGVRMFEVRGFGGSGVRGFEGSARQRSNVRTSKLNTNQNTNQNTNPEARTRNPERLLASVIEYRPDAEDQRGSSGRAMG